MKGLSTDSHSVPAATIIRLAQIDPEHFLVTTWNPPS